MAGVTWSKPIGEYYFALSHPDRIDTAKIGRIEIALREILHGPAPEPKALEIPPCIRELVAEVIIDSGGVIERPRLIKEIRLASPGWTRRQQIVNQLIEEGFIARSGDGLALT
jgi:hypothetical protein